MNATLAGFCRDCRWWGFEDDLHEQDAETHRCALAMMLHGEPLHPESKAIAWDGSEQVASLETQAWFGCVQWESAA